MTLPKDHVIVKASIESVNQGFRYLDHPAIFVYFDSEGMSYTPEQLLAVIMEYPKHVVFQGNPLGQDQDFLQMALVELTDKDHIVTIEGTTEHRKIIPWKLFEPNVRFNLWAENFTCSAQSYRKFRECDIIWFSVESRDDYENARAEILANRDWVQCQFKMRCMSYYDPFYDLPHWIIEDQLEVSIIRDLF